MKILIAEDDAISRTILKKLLTANRCVLVGFGLSLLYWITESFLDLFDAEHVNASYFERLLTSGDTNELRMRIMTVVLLIGFSIYAQFLTNRRARLVETRAQLASIVQSSNLAIFSRMLDSTITTWNKGAEMFFSYTAEQAIGQPSSIIVPPHRRDELTQILERAKRGEHTSHYETVRLTNDGGEIDVSLVVSPIKDAEGNFVDAIVSQTRKVRDRVRI